MKDQPCPGLGLDRLFHRAHRSLACALARLVLCPSSPARPHFNFTEHPPYLLAITPIGCSTRVVFRRPRRLSRQVNALSTLHRVASAPFATRSLDKHAASSASRAAGWVSARDKSRAIYTAVEKRWPDVPTEVPAVDAARSTGL
jgi:hypothetical protein